MNNSSGGLRLDTLQTGQRMLRSSCPIAQSDLTAIPSANRSDVSADMVSPRSDWADAKADLDLHCPHMTRENIARTLFINK